MIPFSKIFSSLSLLGLMTLPLSATPTEHDAAHSKPNDHHLHSAHPELDETLRAVEDLKAKIASLCEERNALKLRIQAGDQAGAEIEHQLNAAHELAEREHARAETISAEILKQVDAQKAIAAELKSTITRISAEREALLAKLNTKPKVDPTEKKRLLAENEKLSGLLKEAWEKNKASDEIQSKLDLQSKKMTSVEQQLAETIASHEQLKEACAKKEAELKSTTETKTKLETEISKLSANYETKLKERTAELSSALKEKESLQAALEKQIAAVKATEEKAVAQRADALRERIARQKLEAELASMQAAAKQAAEAEAAAAKAKAEYEAQLLIIAPIYFGKNQADSEQQEQSLLAQVKEISTLFPQARYSISGHTCTDGTPAGNLALSQRRAQRVANLLVTNGIPSAAIAEVIGKGQETPIADNNTQQGREANRRVEIKVLKE